MRFGGHSAREITAEDIEQLVSDKEAEDGTLDFKRESYPRTNDGKKEFLRDVVSFANADGGYLIIGIGEAGQRADRLCHIDNATDEASRLLDLCLQGIQPKIRDLEIIPKRIPTKDIEIIVIRIPESAARPHMVALNDSTYFCRRHQDRKRSMSIEELQEAFGRRVTGSHPGLLDQLRSEVARLSSILSANRLSELQPTEPVQNAVDAAEVRKIMDLRFREQVGESPYFRMTATPRDMSSVDLSGYSAELAKLLEDPPQTRPHGWVIYPTTQVKRSTEGWQAVSQGGRALILLINGHLEYWHPCDDSTFQWGRQTAAGGPPELYPFAVCELPVNFTRLAKRVYEMSKFEGEVVFRLEFANIRGYVLRPGVPDSIAYMMPATFVENGGYDRNDLVIPPMVVAADFDPDKTAFLLVEQVYQAFGISRKYIPCFANGQTFDISVNSSEE